MVAMTLARRVAVVVGVVCLVLVAGLVRESEVSYERAGGRIPVLIPLSATVTSPGTNLSLPARPATFGPMIPPSSNETRRGGFTGSLAEVGSLACNADDGYEDLREKIALVRRGGCGFYDKVLVLQEWGAVAVIVGDNVRRRGLVTMFTKEEIDMARVPSVFVSYESYDILREVDTVTIETTAESSPIADTMVFLLISPLCSLSLIYGLLLFHRRYRVMKERAPRSLVNTLPTRIWQRPPPPPPPQEGNAGPSSCLSPRDGPEKIWVSSGECIICLEDYVPGVSKVMRLPCDHEFHADCITKWLVGRKKTCPICKQDVTKLSETTPLIKPPRNVADSC
ncbi:hypothetical protein TRVA0_060S00474 [Trichomonascus vanleenenianus]|uniref:uncharacterized protein n=1 Tax=Trichomonascus vanleenenianus TaxID=2268995 RepID=UPI003ECBAF45